MGLKNKKGMHVSAVMILIAGIVILALLIVLALYFKQGVGESGIFQYATDWTGLKWK